MIVTDVVKLDWILDILFVGKCQVLDAPALQDDFYLNLVDWSAQNVLAVGLGNCVYLWNACSSKASVLISSHSNF